MRILISIIMTISDYKIKVKTDKAFIKAFKTANPNLSGFREIRDALRKTVEGKTGGAERASTASTVAAGCGCTVAAIRTSTPSSASTRPATTRAAEPVR